MIDLKKENKLICCFCGEIVPVPLAVMKPGKQFTCPECKKVWPPFEKDIEVSIRSGLKKISDATKKMKLKI